MPGRTVQHSVCVRIISNGRMDPGWQVSLNGMSDTVPRMLDIGI